MQYQCTESIFSQCTVRKGSLTNKFLSFILDEITSRGNSLLYAIHTNFAQNPHPTLIGQNSQLRAGSKHIKFFIPAIIIRVVRKGWAYCT